MQAQLAQPGSTQDRDTATFTSLADTLPTVTLPKPTLHDEPADRKSVV